jgi:hypothetical protein
VSDYRLDKWGSIPGRDKGFSSGLGVLDLFSSMSTIVVLFSTSEHRHITSTRASTVYKYVKEHYPISKEHHGAHKQQAENPALASVSRSALRTTQISIQWVVGVLSPGVKHS